jgi:chitinase
LDFNRTGDGTERIADIDLPGMSTYFDWINVMICDFHGGWEAKTGHNAPLYKNNNETTSDIAPSFIKSKYNCDAAIQGYLAAGVPSHKILMEFTIVWTWLARFNQQFSLFNNKITYF